MRGNRFAADWLPSVVFAALALVFGVVYACIPGEKVYTVYLQLLGGAVAPFVFPVWGVLTKKRVPPVLAVIVGCLVFFGIHLGKAANFYVYVPHYDKVLHTNFGLVGAALVYTLLVCWGGENLKPAGMIIIVVLAVLGLGAAWELVEYFCGMFFNEDPQNVWAAVDKILAAGGDKVINPLWDTMQDLLVTILGSCLFFIAYLTDRAFGGKLFKKIFTVQKNRL